MKPHKKYMTKRTDLISRVTKPKDTSKDLNLEYALLGLDIEY